jgi:CelD/BcsL family acetyltransferase involved in cellulose biosynthesis
MRPEPPPSHPPKGPRVEVVRTAAELMAHRASWEDLARNHAEANVFYEPCLLLPALEAFADGVELTIVLVFRSNALPGQPDVLCGLFPFERCPRSRGLPVPVLRLWRHPYCYLCTPLVRQREAKAALAALFDWAATDPRGTPLVELSTVNGDGELLHALIDLTNERKLLAFHDERYNRALLRRRDTAEAYLAGAVSAGHRKEIQRQGRRLSELGRVAVERLAAGDDVQPWLDEFLTLEAGGWKGRNGTALACAPRTRIFFVTAARAAFEAGQLDMLRLTLDSRAIAAKCSFRSGEGAFAFKIAYDERYARYSPGIQLELANVEAVHRDPQLRWMDSCAKQAHFMIERLWSERRPIHAELYSTGRPLGDVCVSLLPFLRWTRRALKRWTGR